MIDRLLEAINGSADRAGPMELAEILWLAAKIPAEPTSGPEYAGDDVPETQQALSGAPEDAGRAPARRASTRLFSRGGTAGADGAGLHGMSVLVPKAATIDDSLGLMRSLRPLRRGTFVGVGELDEEATVDRSVEQRVATLVLRSARERQLDLALVVDAHQSMLLWHDLVDELRQVVKHSGVFSDTRMWFLHGTDGLERLELRGVGGGLHSPLEVLGQTRRRLILVVTDTIANGWGGTELGELLEHWADHNPVAVLNVLPEKLWRRGAARSVPTLLRNSTIGTPNRSWQKAAPRINTRRRPGSTIPMVEASAATLGVLAELAAGSRRWHRLACLSFTPGPAARQRDVFARAGSESTTATSDPSSALTRFESSSSTNARRLAGYLAAVPLTMPVMTLVRRAMLPDSENSHLAEVVLGGLFEPWRAVFGEVSADDLEFEFLPGVREALLGAQRRQDVAHVQELVRSYVWQYLQGTRGSGRQFLATQVVTEDGVEALGTQHVPEGQIPFAEQSGHAVQDVGSPGTRFSGAVRLISADDAEDGRALGTGILLTPALILTCGHVRTRPVDAQVYVDGFGWRRPVDTLLISDTSDAALLALREEILAIAHWDFRLDLSRDRELVRPGTDAQIEAFALTHEGEMRPGTVLADVADERQLFFVPSTSGGRFDWTAAHSGAAVVHGDALLGLVIGQFADGAILVLRSSCIVEDAHVRNMLIDRGVSLPDRFPEMPRSVPLCLAVKVDRREGQQPEQEQLRRMHWALQTAGVSPSEAAFLPNAELVIELGSGREALKTLGNILQVLSQQVYLDRAQLQIEWSSDLTVAVGQMDRRALYLPEITAVEPVQLLDLPIPWSRLAFEPRHPQLVRVLISESVFPLLRSHLGLDEMEHFARVTDAPRSLTPVLVYTGDTRNLGRQLAGEVFSGIARVEELTQWRTTLRSHIHIPAAADETAPLFFVSHAAAQRSSPSESSKAVTRFIDGLSRDVDELTDRRTGVDTGFIDLRVQGGARWEEPILEAIGTSQVLVALISDRYIKSEWCGREWGAFSRRQVWQRVDRSQAEPDLCILPVLWTPIADTRRLPSIIARHQVFVPQPTDIMDLPDLYRREGLYGLTRVHPEAYKAVIWQLAKEISRLARDYWTEPSIPSGSHDLANAFEEN